MFRKKQITHFLSRQYFLLSLYCLNVVEEEVGGLAPDEQVEGDVGKLLLAARVLQTNISECKRPAGAGME